MPCKTPNELIEHPAATSFGSKRDLMVEQVYGEWANDVPAPVRKERIPAGGNKIRPRTPKTDIAAQKNLASDADRAWRTKFSLALHFKQTSYGYVCHLNGLTAIHVFEIGENRWRALLENRKAVFLFADSQSPIQAVSYLIGKPEWFMLREGRWVNLRFLYRRVFLLGLGEYYKLPEQNLFHSVERMRKGEWVWEKQPEKPVPVPFARFNLNNLFNTGDIPHKQKGKSVIAPESVIRVSLSGEFEDTKRQEKPRFEYESSPLREKTPPVSLEQFYKEERGEK